MENLKERILERYDVKTDSGLGFLVFHKKNTDKQTTILPGDGEVFISLVNIPVEEQKQENIPKFIQEGKGIMVHRWDLYELFTDYPEDQLYSMFYGYDKRTHLYLQAIEKNIGLIEHKIGYKEEKFDILKQYRMFANFTGSGMVDIGKVDNKKYVAQFSYRTDIDDYCIERIYFDHLPTEKNIQTAILIDNIKTYFILHPGSFKFACWECGREVHWLDVVDVKDLFKKFERLKERYCGC